ncbi:MAG: PASTA domain-containing protein [Parvicellaceae bacterium]
MGVILFGILALVLVVIVLFRKHIKAFLKFLISPLFLINLVLASTAVVLIFYFTMNYLETYTNHDQQLPVPNFIGVHVDDLEAFTEGKELRYVVRDSVFSDDYPLGTVIKQDPMFHTKEIPNYVKPNRRIYLTVVKKIGEYKVIPDLLSNNTSKAVGKAKLEMAGFKVEYELIEHKDKDKIIDVTYRTKSINKNTKLLKGSVITIVYGSGESGEPVLLPKLIGLQIMEAKSLLGETGLNYEVYYDSALNATDSMNFIVYRQNPSVSAIEGGMVPVGSTVILMAKKPELDTLNL